ncbi:hypothetical protein [Bacillus subtilis]|uniref:hypothetical protein n=1 Tax=Bacillus subtilis TaxID=1423 RepID=UPI0021DB6857|nr:hypothetical protein [Bacillus subtilis]
MTEENTIDDLSYVVEEEEDDEETVTLDFDNQAIYSKEESLTITDPASSSSEENDFISSVPPPNTFKGELQDLLLNSITSKAISSLLIKHKNLDTKMDCLLEEQRMGELTPLIAAETSKIMDNRRMELRSCFAGAEIKYERIPKWAQSYVKEYVRDMVHGLSILVEDD